MSTSRFTFVLIFALCIAAAIAILRARGATPSGPPQQATPRAVTSPEVPIRSADVAERVAHVADEGPAPSHATVIVLDAWRRALPGAAVFEERVDLEWYTPTGESLLGRTDETGRLAIPIVAGPRALCIGKPGYLSQRLQLSAGAEAEILLVEGGSTSFLCRSRADGRPIEGVEVMVRAHVENARGDERRRWDQPPAGSIPAVRDEVVPFVATSGADGIARLSGLVPGRQGFWAWHEGQVLVHGPGLSPSDERVVETGGGPYELEFLPITACGYRVLGDEVVSTKIDPVSDGPRQAWGIGTHDCGWLRTRLLAEHPGAQILVFPMCRELRLTLLFRKAGKHEFTLAFKPLAEFRRDGPVDIDASALPAEGTPVAIATLRILNADGSELRGVPFMLLDMSGAPFKRARSGERVLVPHGTYTFAAMQGSVKLSMTESLVMPIGVQHGGIDGESLFELRLTRTLRPVILETKVPTHAVIEARYGDGRKALIPGESDASRREAWLPAGEFEFYVVGSSELLGRAVIEAGPVEPMVIPLQAER